MTTLVETLITIQFPIESLPPQSLSESGVISKNNNNNQLTNLSSQSDEQIQLFNYNVHNHDIVVLWLGSKDASLRTALIEHLTPRDVLVIVFSTEQQLSYWFNTNSISKIVFLVIESNNNIQNILSSSRIYESIHSILIRCRTDELTDLKRLARSYIKIDGVYNDDTRILIKLALDLALILEEMGDEQRENHNNELEAQRNYDQAIKFCQLARQL